MHSRRTVAFHRLVPFDDTTRVYAKDAGIEQDVPRPAGILRQYGIGVNVWRAPCRREQDDRLFPGWL
jgi:hypothetical protein